MLLRPTNIIVKRGLCITLPLILSLAIYLSVHYDFPPLHQGLPHDPNLRKQLHALSISPTTSLYYTTIGDRRLFESQTLWHARLAKSDLILLMDSLGMKASVIEHVDDEFKKKAPYWWNPKLSANTKVFSSSGFSFTGKFQSEGWFAFATWDPADERVNMWIVENN